MLTQLPCNNTIQSVKNTIGKRDNDIAAEQAART